MASRPLYRAAFAAALVAGTVARVWNLRDQVASGDELHAVRAALAHPVGAILVTYQKNDNCLPLTALYRVWMDAGGPLTELVLRLPVLLCGLALLWWLPRAAGRRLGDGVALALAWLLALSPLLVLYSRIARSYLPIVLLGSLAAIHFAAWWTGGSRRAAATYVLSAALAVFFHLLAAPFVLAPLAFAAADLAVRRQVPERPRPGALAALALITAAALAAFLLPALDSLRALLTTKGGEGALDSQSLAGLAKLWAGTRQPLLVALFWSAAAAGLVLLWRRQRLLAVYSLVLLAAQAAGLAVLAPFLVGVPLVLSRYMIIALPLVLLWVAVALAALATAARTGRAPLRAAGTAAAAVFVAALHLAGPLADPAVRDSSFAQSADYLDFSRPYPTLPVEAVPAFYRELPGQGPIAEAPWPTSQKYGRSLLVSERQHGQRVLVVPYDEALDDPRLRFRNLLRSPEAALDSPARWLALHVDLAAEEQQLAEADALRGRYSARAASEAELQRRWAADTARRLVAQWGEPDLDDERLLVWDLARVRAATIAR